jgi:hypothetical protein
MGGTADVEAADGGAPAQAKQPFDIQAIIKQVQAAKEGSGGPADYVQTVGGISQNACSKACAVPFVVCAGGLYLAMIVIGAIYLNDCTLNDKIPIWLIVMGVFGVLKLLVDHRNLIPVGNCRNQTEEQMAKSHVGKIATLLTLFHFAWIITGNVWVFELYEPNYEPNDSDTKYCNQTVYLFAFWVMVSMYIIMGIFIGLTCLCGCIGCFACACCKVCKS